MTEYEDDVLEAHEDDEDQLLDLSDLAPPRTRVKVRDGVTVELLSPREFGVKKQAELDRYQRRLRTLMKQTPNAEHVREQQQIFRKVVRIVADGDPDTLDSLNDVEMELIVRAFTARLHAYQRRVAEAIGEDQEALKAAAQLAQITES